MTAATFASHNYKFSDVEEFHIGDSEHIYFGSDDNLDYVCKHALSATMKDGHRWKVMFPDNAIKDFFLPLLPKEFPCSCSEDTARHLNLSAILEEAIDVEGSDKLKAGMATAQDVGLNKIFEDSSEVSADEILTKEDSSEQEVKKKHSSDSSWQSTALAVTIVAAIILAAVVVVGGALTGFVFTCIYCPLAGEIIGVIAAVVIIKLIGLGILMMMRSR